jgi:Protein of unknown function (DUF4232)
MSRRMPGSCLRAPRLPLAIAAGAVAAATAALAACGSVPAGSAGAAASSGAARTGPATTGPATTGPATTGPATATCAASGLKVKLDMAAAGAAAGSYYVPLEFTNITGHACQLAGYPAVALTSGVSGRQIGPQAAVDRSVRSAAVRLAPGGTAHAWLQVTDVANIPARRCHPATAAGMRVEAPGARGASYLAHRLPACAAALAGDGVITVHPVQPGRARRGTA